MVARDAGAKQKDIWPAGVLASRLMDRFRRPNARNALIASCFPPNASDRAKGIDMTAHPGPDDETLLPSFLAENPDLERNELLFPDMNGVFCGKWLPPEGARSAAAADIFGKDC
jgi:hypothetical protein